MAKKYNRLNENDDLRIAYLFGQGNSVDEIAEEMNVARSTAMRHLKDMGLIAPKEEAEEPETSNTEVVAMLKSIDARLATLNESLAQLSGIANIASFLGDISEALTMLALKEDQSPLAVASKKEVTSRS